MAQLTRPAAGARRRTGAVLLAVLCSAVLLVKLPVPAGWRADLPPERMLAQPADLPADWEQRQDSRGASLLVRELVSDSATRIWADDRLQVVQTVERYHAPMLAALGADRSDASSAALAGGLHRGAPRRRRPRRRPRRPLPLGAERRGRAVGPRHRPARPVRGADLGTTDPPGPRLRLRRPLAAHPRRDGGRGAAGRRGGRARSAGGLAAALARPGVAARGHAARPGARPAPGGSPCPVGPPGRSR